MSRDVRPRRLWTVPKRGRVPCSVPRRLRHNGDSVLRNLLAVRVHSPPAVDLIWRDCPCRALRGRGENNYRRASSALMRPSSLSAAALLISHDCQTAFRASRAAEASVSRGPDGPSPATE